MNFFVYPFWIFVVEIGLTRPRKPRTQRNQTASASQRVKLKIKDTTPDPLSRYFFKKTK